MFNREGGNTVILNSTFSRNKAMVRTALAPEMRLLAVFISCGWTCNTSVLSFQMPTMQFGGALFNYNGDVTIKYSKFLNNGAEQVPVCNRMR